MNMEQKVFDAFVAFMKDEETPLTFDENMSHHFLVLAVSIDEEDVRIGSAIIDPAFKIPCTALELNAAQAGIKIASEKIANLLLEEIKKAAYMKKLMKVKH